MKKLTIKTHFGISILFYKKILYFNYDVDDIFNPFKKDNKRYNFEINYVNEYNQVRQYIQSNEILNINEIIKQLKGE